MILPLTNEDKSHLKRLNENKSTVFALKKLFLNVCTTTPASNEAIEKITKAFYDLSVIQPSDEAPGGKINLV